MSALTKAYALLNTCNPSDLDDMSPTELQRISELMWTWHRIAERRIRLTNSGAQLGGQPA